MLTEIVGMMGVCLAVAFGCGMILGWLARYVWSGEGRSHSQIVETGQLEAELSALRRESADATKTREGLLSRVRSLEAELSAQKTPIFPLISAAIEPKDERTSSWIHDDLEEIPGIGPNLATLLHGIGVTRFEQIAQWTDIDIDQVEARQPELLGRVREENWVASAKACQRRKDDAMTP